MSILDNIDLFIILLSYYMKLSAWIDFWTTNTAVWYSQWEWDVNMAHIWDNWRSTTERTAIFYDFSDVRNPIIGEGWRQLYIEGQEGKLITSPKSFLKAQELPKVWVLRQRYDLIEIISHILIEFKSRLEKEAWENIDSILVGRPVKFHDDKPELDRLAQDRLEKAFRLAGFRNVEFQYEPIAAYSSFVHSNPGKINSWDTTLVVDLWWGTSDFSVVLQWGKESKVIGNGWVYIGWDDIDQRLIFSHYSDYFWKKSLYKSMTWQKLNVPVSIFWGLSDKTKLLFFRQDFGKIIRDIFPLLISDQDKIDFGRLKEILEDLWLGYYLHSIVEQAKITLTEEERALSDFSMFSDSFTTVLSQVGFEELILEEVDRICWGIQDVLNQTWVTPQGIHHVVLNGGTGFIPLVQNSVEQLLWKWKLLHGNTLSSVWYGLTLESWRIFK